MTTRERNLAGALGGVLGVGLLGFVAYSFVISPYRENSRLIKQREQELENLEDQIGAIELKKRKFEADRLQSLPKDVGVSRTQYADLLEKMCRRAELTSGLRIQNAEPDNKNVPMLGAKKPAYTRLTYELTVKGDLYHLVDFLRTFYQQPLLHEIKKFTVQRPGDNRQQGRKELDVTMTVEALVLDNALPRGTLLPVVREVALLSGPAAYVGLNVKAVADGKGSPIPPAGVLAEPPREYLAVAGKNIFFGPPPVKPKEREDPPAPPEDDLSPWITLTSVVGHDDGTVVAAFRDKSTNNNFTITQKPKGQIEVVGEYEIVTKDAENKPVSKIRLLPGYSRDKPVHFLSYGTEDGQNRMVWRVRGLLLDGVILEKVDPPAKDTKPKVHPLAGIAGGIGAVLAVPEGKMYRVGMGQGLGSAMGLPGTPATKYLLNREAWRDIYAPSLFPVSTGK